VRVFAYCCASFKNITRKAAGVEPLTSPPSTVYNLDLALLENNDLLYFDLHGSPGATCWLGDDRTLAMTAAELSKVNLTGAIVFAVNCHLADAGSPMLDALLSAGAHYVIGGDGQNWAGSKRAMIGAGLLGLWFRRLLARGAPPLVALSWAKRRVKLSTLKRGKRLAAKDTLEFRAYYREVT